MTRKFGWHSGVINCVGLILNAGVDRFSANTGEVHAFDLKATGSTRSGGSIVGHNIVLTTAGTAGTWASAIYAKVTEGTTKNINGYISAAELELAIGGTYNPSDLGVLVLNSTITNTNLGNCTHKAYIYLRDYGTDSGAALGSTSMPNLFWFGDQTIGSDSDGASLLAANTIASSTHTIRFLIGTTPYYIMCANTTHN
jgi:hypothetical protein